MTRAWVVALATAALAAGCTIDWRGYRVRDAGALDSGAPADARDDLAQRPDADAAPPADGSTDAPVACGYAGGACCALQFGTTARCASGLRCEPGSQTCLPCTLAVDGRPLPGGVCHGVCRGDGRCVTAVQLALGRAHSCARMNDGSLRCWGANSAGQLGVRSITPENAPLAVVLSPPALQATHVALGGEHTCGLFADGSLRCWGRNASGQLGNPRRELSAIVPDAVHAVPGFANTPVVDDAGCAARPDAGGELDASAPDAGPADAPLPPLDGGPTNGDYGLAADLALGEAHTCALLERPRRRVVCWGDNAFGQVGRAPAGGVVTAPAEVPRLCGPELARVAAGAAHACAQVSPAGVVCWGAYFPGAAAALGGNDPGGAPIDGVAGPEPRWVSPAWGRAPVEQLVSGAQHTCVRAGDQAYCWGDNASGQLGRDTASDGGAQGGTLVPAAVAGGLLGVAAVAAGGAHTCALLVDRTVRCWGDNGAGQLGHDPAHLTRTATPLDIGLHDVAEVAAGGQHTCVRLMSGAVRCFGRNADGQLGEGTAVTYSARPVRVPGVSAEQLAAGGQHTCATERADGGTRVTCWGANEHGQLGDGTTEDREAPAPVRPLRASDPPITWETISLGRAHSCGMATDGTVYCWGAGAAGQLGTPGDALGPTPILASRALNPASIAMGHDYSCMRTLGERALCWGTIGASPVVGAPLPVSPALRTVQQVATRARMACVRTLASSRAVCWYGADPPPRGFGPLGGEGSGDGGVDGDAGGGGGGGVDEVLHDIELPGSFVVDWIAAGDQFACAVGGVSNAVFCWGLNTSLQLGNPGVFALRSDTPVLVTDLDSVERLALGSAHACALTLEGRVRCWGHNGFGQLGRGFAGNPTARVEFIGTPLDRRVHQIAAGDWHTCAVVGDDNAVYCWGSNSAGQLGQRAPRDRFAPVSVLWPGE